MAIGIAAVLVILAVVFFVRQAGGEQRLYPDYTFNFSPLKTSAEVKQDVFVPVDTVWKKFTDISNYHLWFPWIKKIRVTHEDVNRWVLKHATDRYQPEVGRYFHVQPFFGAPYTKCRYIGIEQNKSLVLEMRFFPFCKELVTFTLTSYSNCVELSYKLKSSGLLSPISAFMFSWRGKSVLHNLVGFIPPVQEVESRSRDALHSASAAEHDRQGRISASRTATPKTYQCGRVGFHSDPDPAGIVDTFASG